MRQKTFKKILFLCIVILLTSISLQSAYYNVSGYVFLEGQTDHSGVKIKFYNLPSMEPEDSTYSQANGYYSINISPGYYLVEWTKDGYVPWELGGFALVENTELEAVTLVPGEVMEVSGFVSGTWTTNYVYYVTSDITIPSGLTLTINAGVRVKFSKGTNLICSGKLIVNGTAENPVIFTSREPTPLPGDWGNVTLNTTYNSINYLNYEYASDGIVGNNAHYTTIDHLTIKGNLNIDARGIYFSNSYNLTITNNYISVSGEYGIYAYNSDNSNISGNTVITPNNGIRAESSDNSIISNNTITTTDNTTGPKNGIYTSDSPGITIENNTIVADENGIYTPNSYKAVIKNNHITGRIYWNGIQFTNSDSSKVIGNYVHRTKENGDTYSWQYLINGDNSEYSEICENDLYFWNNSYAERNMALRSEWSKVKSNIIVVKVNDQDFYIIHDDRNSDIINNEIKCNSYSHGDTKIILSYSYEDTNSNNISKIISKIIGNDIEYSYEGNSRFEGAIWCQSNKIIRNNKITANYIRRAIYCQSNCDVDSNIIVGDFDTRVIEIDGDSTFVHDNKITRSGSGSGIYIQGQTGIEIGNNIFYQTGSGKWLDIDNSNINVHHNIVTTGSGRGIHIYNQSSGAIWNNTIVSKSNGDYAVYIEGTNIPVYNNILVGFQNGIYANNTIENFNLDHNAFWNISNLLFNGEAVPPLAGEMVDNNVNGDECDIYENINLNPQFVYPDTNNFNLSGNSPCINAGRDGIKDPDSTTSDIGALYYPIWIAIEHTPLPSTDDTIGPYTVTAKIFSPIGEEVSAQVLYSTDNKNFTAIDMTKGDDNTFSAGIPGQSLNTTIYYYIKAEDGTHTVTSPLNTNEQVYSFYITLFSQFANLSGASDLDGKIILKWATPIPISGTLDSLKLYRSLTQPCEITPENLIKSFGSDVTEYTDFNLEEGVTYYYKLTGIVQKDGTEIEALVSPELAITYDDPRYVRATGYAILQNAEDYSGTKVLFEKASPSAVTDITFTNSDGYFSKILVTGIYNVYFSHDGYQPKLLGNIFFSSNVNLDTVNLVEGGVVYLSGNVKGSLTNNNLYLVVGDVTIPEGETLTIESGTQVLFTGKYSITANGKLFVNGTPEKKVIFSSRTPVPSIGDWGNITLNSAASGSVIKYAEYKYATDGIVCNNLDSITIWGMDINTLDINARGITFNNCDNVDIRYNTINITGDWAICKNESWNNYGIFVGNKITSNNNGILAHSYNNLIIDSNYVEIKGTGIKTDYSKNLKLRYNTVTGKNFHTGVHAYDCDQAIIHGNNIDGAKYNGFNLENCNDGTVDSNYVHLCGPDGWKIAFNCGEWTWTTRMTFSNNKILIDNVDGEGYGWIAFRYGENNTYINNQINLWHNWSGEANAFRDINNSIFKNNYIRIKSISDWYAYCGNNNISENDTLILGYSTGGYYGSNWKIKNCIIKAPDRNNSYEAIYSTGGKIEVSNVTIENCCKGIYGTGTGGYIKHCLIKVYGDGLKFENNSNVTLYQNSIIGNGSSTGLITTSNSIVKTNSCIIYGFLNGLSAESENHIQTSLFYNNTNNFTGSSLPQVIGQIVTVNLNAFPSDIYGNIYADPLFVNPDSSDYHLKPGSPCINAGDIDSLDLDGTVADIGAFSFNHGYAPQNLVADSSGNGWVMFSWEIIETDSLQGFVPYYKLSSETDWTALEQTTEKFAVVSDLTNNVSYDFCAAAVYPNKISHRSILVSAKPGEAKIEILPKYIIVYQQPGEEIVKEFTINNIGTKDYDFKIFHTRISQTEGSIPPSSSLTIKDTVSSDTLGIFIYPIPIIGKDRTNPSDSVWVLNVVGNYSNLEPTKFIPVDTTTKVFYLIVDSVEIDGNPLITGDEIGIYDGDICVGAGGFNGVLPMVIQCFGNDGSSPGYVDGDSITIKLYRYDRARFATLYSINFKVGNGTFMTGGFSKVSLKGTMYRVAEISLAANKFNLISTYLYPNNSNASDLFRSLKGLKIVYEDNGAAYIPEYNINTIGDIDITEGYYVFIEGNDQTLTITGLSINPEDYPITLHSKQFNFIAYLNDEPMPVTEAFYEIADQIEIVQDEEGGVWIPDMEVNTLENLVPLSGYQVFTNATETISFTFPPYEEGLSKKVIARREEPEPNRFIVSATGLPYAIVVNSATMDGHQLEEGDEIGVFDGDICVGSTVWKPGDKNVAIAWKGNRQLNVPGYVSGNEMKFKAYSKRFDKEFELIPRFRKPEESRFEGSAYSVVDLTGKPGLIPEKFALHYNYPNPFNSRTNIKYDVPEKAEVTLIIYDILGKEVVRLKNAELHKPGRYVCEWDGRNKYGAEVSSGLYFVRMVSKDFQKVNKMLLIK